MYKRVVSDLLVYLPSKLLPALTPFITVPIFTHLFTPDEFGTYTLAFGIAELLLAGTCTGFASSALRFYTPYRQSDNLPTYFAALLLSVCAIVGLAAGITAVVLLLARHWISSDLYSLLWLAVLTFAANAFVVTLSHVLRAQERSAWYTIVELLNRYGTIAISITLALLGFGVISMLWGQFVTLALLIVPLLWLTSQNVTLRGTPVKRADIRQMWTYAIPLTAGNVAFWTLRISDRYIIEIFQRRAEVGFYAVSSNIASRSIGMLVSLFLLVPAPVIMRVWEEQGREACENLLTLFTRMFFLMICPAVIGLGVLAAPLVRLLADEAYFEGHRTIWWIAGANMAFGFSQLCNLGLLLANRTRLLACNQFIATGVSLTLNLLLIPIWGFMGAAFSMFVSFTLMAWLQMRSSAQFLTWYWPRKSIIHAVFASVVMGGVVLMVVNVLGGNDASISRPNLAIILLATVALGGVIYSTMLVLLGEIALRDIRHMLSSKHKVVSLPGVSVSGGES
jgi:O-antigen/teichoic acid export membrane protein